MTVRITKAQAIEAIRTEPLLATGAWAGRLRDVDVKAGDETSCKVCAVGAVLRDLIRPELSYQAIKSTALTNVEGQAYTAFSHDKKRVEEQVRGLILKDAVWNALSVLYEGYSVCQVWDPNTDRCTPTFADQQAVREAVCQFVEAEFPDDWELIIEANYVRPGVAKEVTT